MRWVGDQIATQVSKMLAAWSIIPCASRSGAACGLNAMAACSGYSHAAQPLTQCDVTLYCCSMSIIAALLTVCIPSTTLTVPQDRVTARLEAYDSQ